MCEEASHLSPNTLRIETCLDELDTGIVVKVDVVGSHPDHWAILCVHLLRDLVHRAIVSIVHAPEICPCCLISQFTSTTDGRCFFLTCMPVVAPEIC